MAAATDCYLHITHIVSSNYQPSVLTELGHSHWTVSWPNFNLRKNKLKASRSS